MTESSNAVFLSYASQDAAAAARICEALRAADIEVWFDQSELRGGDAWDRQIKKQIHECALFVPIISANSQARLEGYFRLEWRLAVKRTHLMADRKAFLVPVIIDNTKDKEAEVPDSFRAMQWTRLPGGETPAEFCERVRVLLGVAETLSQSQAAGRQRRPVTPTRNSNRWSTVVAAGLLMAGVIGWQAWRMVQPKASSASAPTALATAPEKSIAVLPSERVNDFETPGVMRLASKWVRLKVVLTPFSVD